MYIKSAAGQCLEVRSVSEHFLGGVGHVKEAIFILLLLVNLSHGQRHAAQTLVVDEQVEGLSGQQRHPVPEVRGADRMSGDETKKRRQKSLLATSIGCIPFFIFSHLNHPFGTETGNTRVKDYIHVPTMHSSVMTGHDSTDSTGSYCEESKTVLQQNK